MLLTFTELARERERAGPLYQIVPIAALYLCQLAPVQPPGCRAGRQRVAWWTVRTPPRPVRTLGRAGVGHLLPTNRAVED